jgi:hypothetical protein
MLDRGLAVQADQRPHEQTQPVGSRFGQFDVGGRAGAAVDEHLFQRRQIISGQWFVASRPLQREVVLTLLGFLDSDTRCLYYSSYHSKCMYS